MNSAGVVQLVSMLGFIPVFFQGGSGGNHFAEIIQDQARPNLLLDVIELFRMKTGQANRILQFSERGFNSPTHMIQLFDFICGEIFIREICNDAFKRAI